MTARATRHRLALIIEYEPSWFSECMSAIGILLWSIAALMSDDYEHAAYKWLLPAFGLVFGPARAVLLVRLSSAPRVLAASLSFLWWALLMTALFNHYGLIPAEGAFAALALGDLLTVAKFSLAAMQLRRRVV